MTTKIHPPELVEHVSEVLASIDVYIIQAMERQELVDLQRALGYGETWGLWLVPEEWCAKRTYSQRIVQYKSVGTPEGDRIWMESLRICLILSLARSSRTISAPVTVCCRGKVAVRLCTKIAKMPGRSTTWWSRLSDDDVPALGRSERELCSILKNLYRRGLLAEQTRPRKQDVGATERDRRNEDVGRTSIHEEKTYQPLPDEFTKECGSRVLWMVSELGPSLLDCYEACINTPLPAPTLRVGRKVSSERVLRNAMYVKIVRDWTWRWPSGEKIVAVPFELRFRTRIGCSWQEPRKPTVDNFSWPPRTWGDITFLVGLLQTCHAWMLFLASGPRVCTILSHTTSCLEPSPNGWRLLGVEFKKQGTYGVGRRRDWPVAPVLVAAIQQQIRLADLVKRRGSLEAVRCSGTDNLWVQTSSRSRRKGMGGDFTHMNSAFDTLVSAFGVGHLLSEDNPTLHAHRFRKTLARILALALTSGQTILMDCFGHADPDETLGYMLSDRAIVSDAMTVQRELVILLAKDALEASEHLGGPAGETVRNAKRQYLRIHSKSTLSPEDAYELADQLTLGGREWVYVMEGVICTLSQFGVGPCGAKKKLRRDPLNCQPGCNHQLIQAHYKNRTDDMIAYLVRELERAVADEAEMLIASLAGQLRNHLYRWKDVFEKWTVHPLVQRFGELKKAPIRQDQRSTQ